MKKNNSGNAAAPEKKFDWDSLVGKTIKIWTSQAGLHYCIGRVTNYQHGYLQLRDVLLQRTRKEKDSIPVERIQKIEEIV